MKLLLHLKWFANISAAISSSERPRVPYEKRKKNHKNKKIRSKLRFLIQAFRSSIYKDCGGNIFQKHIIFNDNFENVITLLNTNCPIMFILCKFTVISRMVIQNKRVKYLYKKSNNNNHQKY